MNDWSNFSVTVGHLINWENLFRNKIFKFALLTGLTSKTLFNALNKFMHEGEGNLYSWNNLAEHELQNLCKEIKPKKVYSAFFLGYLKFNIYIYIYIPSQTLSY